MSGKNTIKESTETWQEIEQLLHAKITPFEKDELLKLLMQIEISAFQAGRQQAVETVIAMVQGNILADEKIKDHRDDLVLAFPLFSGGKNIKFRPH